MANFVNYVDLDCDMVGNGTPEPKTIPNKNITYHSIPLNYNYAVDEEPKLDGIYIQGPEVVCNGIYENTFEDGSKGLSMSMSFQESNEEHAMFLVKWDPFFQKTAKIVFECKMAGGARTVEAFIDGGAYNNPIDFPKDRTTKEIIPGRPRRISPQIINQGRRKTQFFGLDGNVIGWDLLREVEVRMIPLYYVRDIFVGTKMKLRVDLYSAVVVDIRLIDMIPRQQTVIKEITDKDASMASAFADKIKRIEEERSKEAKAKQAPPPPSSKSSSKGQGMQSIKNDAENPQSGAVKSSSSNFRQGTQPRQGSRVPPVSGTIN